MAKPRTGLPQGFDIGVTSQDLAGPAALPGYLDDDPIVEFARMRKEHAHSPTPQAPHKEPAPPAAPPRTPVVQPLMEVPTERQHAAPPNASPAAQQASQPVSRRRLQINLDPEGERMVEELLDWVSDQSSERRIKISEFVQALVLNLYNARSEISLGSLPQRGRWGSPTAKSFPAALAQAFREAIVSHDQRIGGNQFKKASGG